MTIKIRDINLEMENLITEQTKKINGGDNPGMAPPGAYEAGVSGNCSSAGSDGLSQRNCRRYFL